MKPAIKTSEFWLNAVSVIFGAVASSGLLTQPGINPMVTQITGLIVMILGAVTHTASRTVLKSAQIPNLATPTNPLAPSIEVKL